MILACPFCQSRFLVSASLFDKGPRQMRCARCKHSWRADIPQEAIDALTPVEAEKPPKAASKAWNAVAMFWQALPTMVKQALKITIATLAVLLFLVWAVTQREQISNTFPQLENVYNNLGLHVYHYGGEGLLFRQMRSELRYESGITKLYVEGKIHNGSRKVQEIPNILASAVGADGAIIQSWQIDAPAVRVAPDEDIVFHSSINAPRASVADITLKFVEPNNASER